MDRLTPVARIVAWRLLDPRMISVSELIGAVWPPDEEPEHAEAVVKNAIWRVKQYLVRRGVPVVSRYGIGHFIPGPKHRSKARELLAAEIAQNHRWWTTRKGTRLHLRASRLVAIVGHGQKATAATSATNNP